MFGLGGVEISLCLVSDGDRVLAFVFFRHGGGESASGLSGGGIFCGLLLNNVQYNSRKYRVETSRWDVNAMLMMSVFRAELMSANSNGS